MIIDALLQAAGYASLNPRLTAAFDFLRSPDLSLLPDGRYEVEGPDLVAIVTRTQGKPREEARLEAHRKFIDIHYIVAGAEEMGWSPLPGCTTIAEPYDEGKDILFFADRPATWAEVSPGSFALFFPGDAHAPLVSRGTVHKVIMKVRTSESSLT